MPSDYAYDQGFAEERTRLGPMESLWDPGTQALLDELGLPTPRTTARLQRLGPHRQHHHLGGLEATPDGAVPNRATAPTVPSLLSGDILC